jgi:hypothetical protein
LSDILAAIGGLFSNGWHFLMNTFIPGTDISFGAVFVGLALIPVGFSFLSIALGHNIGEATSGYGNIRSTQRRLSKARENDTR